MFDLRKIFDLRKFFAVPKNFLKSKIHCIQINSAAHVVSCPDCAKILELTNEGLIS